jgi:hypothetical protein
MNVTGTKAKKLFDELVDAYYPSDKKNIASFEAAKWISTIKNCQESKINEVLTKFYESFPPSTAYGKLPPVKEFKKIYQEITKPTFQKLGYCPCCGSTPRSTPGDRFVIFEIEKDNKTTGYTFDCICWTNSGRKRRTRDFQNFNLNVCDNECCMNPQKETNITVNHKQGRYFKNYLINCKFKPSINEEKPK